jgi:hypothetical protein
MPRGRHAPGPGLREVCLVWGLYLFVAAEIFATYSRLPVHELYHVSANGRAAGAGRALVFLNWPVALAAIPMLAVVAAHARSRTIWRLPVMAALLCAAVFWPGVVDQADLDAKWSNAVAACGVALALGLTVSTLVRWGLGPRTRAPGDRLRLGVTVVLFLVALPWLVADLGFLIGRWPVLGSIYYSDEWYASFGHARVHRAVHAGDHHGLVGVLLVVTVLLLSRTLGALGPKLRAFVAAYLAVLLFYGLANIANDFWLEQFVKRGVTNWEFPSMVVPSASLNWLILLLLAVLAYALLFRRIPSSTQVGGGSRPWLAAAVPAFVALLVVGLVHRGTHHRTPLGIANGIAFSAASKGTFHIFVTRGGRVVQLTDADGSDLAPAWSPDRRQIAFQSNRDGNWETYVMNADGSNTRRLTHDDARDGEPSWTSSGSLTHVHDSVIVGSGSEGEWPSWSPDGESLAYDVPFGEHAYGIAINGPGYGIHEYGSPDDRRPSWSPNGQHIAFECRLGDRWRICVIDRGGRHLRVLTPHTSDAYTPAWSPDGRRIAFISDRDGPDQLFVMRADGTHVVRLTSGQGEKDTPTWAGR